MSQTPEPTATEPTAAEPTATEPTTAMPAWPVDRIAEQGGRLLDEVHRHVVGLRTVSTLALATVLAGGHVLFEDLPGLGKTMLCKALSGAMGLEFHRVQGTPDLMPSDITGSSIFDPAERRFEFHPGPVFTGLLLADEINRTSPKTQSALLEAMAEKQVTVEGVTRRLPRPFHVFATSNPVEFEGTYPLPEAQLDRFMVRLSMGYPDPAAEQQIVQARLDRRADDFEPAQVISATDLLAAQAGVEQLPVDPDIVAYAARFVDASRSHPQVEIGGSPRATLALVLVARAVAALDGRPFVLPEDVKSVVAPVLGHRLMLTAESWAQGVTTEQVTDTLLASVAAPATRRG